MEATDNIKLRAMHMFMSLGIKSVTMDDIALQMGISKKTIYQHFDNKNSLIQAVINTQLEDEESQMTHIQSSSADALDELRKMGHYITTTIEKVSDATLFDLQKYYRPLWELYMTTKSRQVIGTMVRNLKRGISEGLYRKEQDADIVAKLYSKAAYMIVDEISNPKSPYNRKQLIAAFHDYHVHGIATIEGLDKWEVYKSAAAKSTSRNDQID